MSRRSLFALLMVFVCCSLPSAADENPFGINENDPLLLNPIYHRLPEIGAQWIRLSADWRIMEQEQGVIDFAPLDARVAEAERHGLNILINFLFVPAWANGSDPSCQPFLDFCSQPPTDPGYYRDFVTAVVDRYKGRVAHYGVWNEPDLRRFWDGDFQRYIDEILIIGSQAIRSTDPDALVVGPDTSGFSQGGRFRHVLQAACQHLDILSGHFYPGDVAGSASEMFTNVNVNYAANINSLCPRPFWVTEFGVRSNFAGEDVQASEYVAAFKGVLALSNIDRMFIHRAYDQIPIVMIDYGILRSSAQSFAPKPSFFALRDLWQSIDQTRLGQVDEVRSGFLALGGEGTLIYSPSDSAVSGLPWGSSGCGGGGPCAATDGKWSVQNDAIDGGLPGFNVFVSFPKSEDAPPLVVTFGGLVPGARYRLAARFTVHSVENRDRGIKVNVEGQPEVLLTQETGGALW